MSDSKNKSKESFREMFSRYVDEWEDYDLRIVCKEFDIFEVGCFGCKHHSEGRGYFGLDHRLTCHLEQEMREE